MAADEHDIVALTKIVVRQMNLTNLVVAQVAEHACFIEKSLERCLRCNLDPVTVEHRFMSYRACDRCAAEMIVKAGKNFVAGFPDDPLNDARASLMREDDWVDTLDADRVRRLHTYVQLIREHDVSPEGVH